MPTPAWKSKSRCASMTCRMNFPRMRKNRPNKISPVVAAKDWAGREDIRDLPLVTIDGETARDFDDAVYCAPEKGGYRLVVAIADVSHYVQTGDALDREAILRGNSVYFPRRVIPMLPEELSNGLCSLNPQVDRLCMVCDMHVGNNGDIGKYRFYPSVMHSQARLTYTQVAAMLAEPDGKLAKSNAAIVPHLQNLYALFQKLLKAREKRGAIDFETVETQMIFTDQGKIERIVPVVRNDAHKLIEECMLAANVCAAGYLHEHGHTVLYRIHEGPTPEKLEALREFMKEFGLQLGGGEEPQAGDYSRLLKQIKGRPDAGLLQMVMLRSLRQAKYEPENVGHFGLGYEAYTHFTSPIRRYPDLLVHRAIKAVLHGKQYKPAQKWERARRALLDDRAPRRRCHARCRGLAEMLLHARPPRQRIYRHGFVGHQLRHVRFAGRSVCRRAGAYLRTRQGLFPFRRRQAPTARRAHRTALSPRRPCARRRR